MAIIIKAKTVSNKVSAKTVSNKVSAKTVSNKVSAKTVSNKVAREPATKRFFLSREAAALWAARGIDLIPCFWAGNSCHGASEYAKGVLAQTNRIKSAKLTAVKGYYLVASSEKGARCVPISHASGSIYERMRDGAIRVRGDAALTEAHIGDIASCQAWLKKHVKKGLTDFWRSKDGSKENARKAGFDCF
jgi:hypothetical protein